MPTKFIKSAIVIALGSAFCSVSSATTIGMNLPTTPVDEDISITGNYTYGLVESSNTNSTFNINSANIKVDMNYGADWIDTQVAGIRAKGTKGSTVNLGKTGRTESVSVNLINNSDKAVLTGKKLDQKIYRHHSGYIGGVKEISARDLLNNNPEQMMVRAVKGMLPHNSLGRQMLKKLRVYAGAEHENIAQKPEIWNF